MLKQLTRCTLHILFYVANVLVTFMGLCIMPILWFAPIHWSQNVARWWCLRLLAHAEYFLNVRWRITGDLSFPKDTPLLIACAHQSAWETLALTIIFANPAFILKSSLLHVPVLGWYLKRLGMIPIHRGRMISKTFLEAVKRTLAQGRSIIIFPEGKRVPVRTPVHCHRGIAFLYQKLQVPVLAISVNSGLFWPPRKFFKHTGCIEAKVHALIPAGLDEAVFLSRLQENLENGNRALLESASHIA